MGFLFSPYYCVSGERLHGNQFCLTQRAADTASPWARRGGRSGKNSLPAVVVGRHRRAADAIVGLASCIRELNFGEEFKRWNLQGRWTGIAHNAVGRAKLFII